jgi:anaerobic magnesium-protoporphyrin IX monomethyl ester cyclase
MHLLLTHGYFLYEDPKELQIMKPYPPLGLLYICSYLKSKGHSVEVFDSTFHFRQDLLSRLLVGRPGILGIYCNLMTRTAVLEIIRVAKQSGWKVVLGGPEPSNYVSEYLSAGADIIVDGEGEATLEELIPALACGKVEELHHINGIAFRTSEGSICETPPRPLIPNLDLLPWPDREAIDISRYIEAWRRHHGTGSVSLITARGCAYHCRWCSHSVYGKTHRRRRPDYVVDEVEWVLRRYQPDMLWMADDVFTVHPGWLFKYADEMKRRNLLIPFECITRADRMNDKVADTLAELKCLRVWIGSESGSQPILDAMERGVTVEEVQQSVHLCKERGIQTGMFLMWGYLGEELADIEATIEHVKRADPDIFLTTVAYPIKGTGYFDDVAPSLAPNRDWQHSSDRDYRVPGRHSREYYHYADQLLKNEVALYRLQKSPAGDSLESSTELITLRKRSLQAREGLQRVHAEVEA